MKKRGRQYTSSKSEAVEFRGIMFRRYPHAKQWSHRVYFTPHAGHRKNGVGAYHQELWKWFRGPIPDGCEIDHIDGNPLNNSIDNLQCITGAEHDAKHRAARSRRQRSPKGLAQLHAASLKARAWHGSEAGRAWHSRNGKRCWKNWQRVAVTCYQCGGEYATPFPHRAKFCSPKCRQKSYAADGRYAGRRARRRKRGEAGFFCVSNPGEWIVTTALR